MPVALTHPGVYIEEISSGVRTITGVATSITAFVGRALRGPVDKPVRVQSFAEFERAFGGLWRESTMSYAVSHFFQNGGGDALIVRVARISDAHASGGRATGTISTLILEASSPGDWGEKLVATVDYATKDPSDTNLFNLTLVDAATGFTENFLNLSVSAANPRFATAVLEQESKLARVTAIGASRPNDVSNVEFSPDGDDGSPITSAEVSADSAKGAKRGIWALEVADLFNLLCIPPFEMGGNVDSTTRNAAAQYCGERRAMFIADPTESWDEPSDILNPNTGGLGLAGSDWGLSPHKNVALYFPRLRCPDPLQENRLVEFAPCGAIAGIFARTDSERGVWKAPAGIEATINSAPDLAVKLTDGECGQLNPRGVNCLRSYPEFGRVVWGARTTHGTDSLASEWKYIPVRRTALFIEETLFRGTQWVVFEPNDEPLWSQIRLNIGAFMQSLFRQGAFQGASPRDAYFVKCDRETTTQDDINRGVVNIVVGFAPLKPAEFVVIKLQQIAGQIAT